MMPRKKRRAILISVILVIFVMIFTIFFVLYNTTDMFKSNDVLFHKYAGQLLDNINTMFNEEYMSEMEEILNNNKLSSNTIAKIEYTETFKREIEEVFKYIVYELKNNIAAEHLLQLIEREIIKRSYNPLIYQSFKLKNKGKYTWYRINVNNYSIFYTVENNVMTIRRFIYSKRDLTNLLYDKECYYINV